MCGSLSNSAVLYDPSCLACVEAECCYELGGCLSGDETCGDYSRCAIDCQRTRDRTSVSLMECLETTCPDLVEAAMTNPAMQAARSCAAESCPGACQPGTL